MADFPLHVFNEWHHPNSFHMSGDAYLTWEGQVRGDINTSTNSWGLGFTGGAIILVVDLAGNVIHRHLVWPLGVNAKAWWWAPSSRTDYFQEQIQSDVAQRADHLELWLGHMPKDRWDEIVGTVRDKVADLRRVYDDIMAAVG